MKRVALLLFLLTGCVSANDPDDMDAHQCEFVEGYADDVDDALGDHLIACHHRSGCSGSGSGMSSGQF